MPEYGRTVIWGCTGTTEGVFFTLLEERDLLGFSFECSGDAGALPVQRQTELYKPNFNPVSFFLTHINYPRGSCQLLAPLVSLTRPFLLSLA